MATIANFPVLDFSGGVRRDKSSFDLRKNELLDARNVEFSQEGRIRMRRGSQQVGQTLTTTIENSFPFVRYNTSGTPLTNLIVNTNGATSVLSTLTSTRLTAAAAVGDTTLTVVANLNTPNDFAASGTLEIDGDLIDYTALSGATGFTGVSLINFAHPVGSAVHQWTTLTQSGTAMDGRLGIYYTVLNNILYMTGRTANMKQYDGSNVTNVTTSPAIILLTNYRDRNYGAGDGSTGTNGSSRRISFSARGDGTSWTTASDFFDIEDQRGQAVTGIRVRNDVMGLFKISSTYTYNEIELKQTMPDVGAYNDKVIVEIDESIFTFCPNGIFETNLFSAKQIGEPVRQYWEQFFPAFDAVSNRICTNTFAWKWQDSYLLYIGSITAPYTASNVVLEYNTRTKSWTTHPAPSSIGGYYNFYFANHAQHFQFGDWLSARSLNIHPNVFAGDTDGHVFRLYESLYVDSATPQVTRGGNLTVDLIGAGVGPVGYPISGNFETPLYDLTHPELFKKFKRLRVYTESGQWNMEYRVENEQGITDYRTLGSVSTTNKVLPFPNEAQGWRCGFRVSSVNNNGTSVFNGFIFEDTEVLPRP